MTQTSPELPLPDQSDYFRSAEMADIDADATYGGINRFLFRKERAYRENSQGVVRLVTKAYQYGARLEPRHEVSGRLVDPTQQTSLVARLGAVGGLVIVEKLHRKVLYTKGVFDNLPYNLQTADPRTLRRYITEMGEQGLDLLGDKTVRVAERWQDAISDDAERQKLFLETLGVVALGAYNAHVAYNKSASAQAFAAEYANFDPMTPEFDMEISAFLKNQSQ